MRATPLGGAALGAGRVWRAPWRVCRPWPRALVPDLCVPPDVQERALWLLASAAGIVLLVAALRPQWEPALTRPPGPVAASAPAAATPDTSRPLPAVPPAFRLAVLNGCGESQVASRMTRKVRDLGLDVIQEGNAPSFGFVESVVIDRSGDLEQAQRVASAVGIPHAIQQISDDAYRLEDVAIVVGRDYRRLGLLDP